jgi:hypothetical protein
MKRRLMTSVVFYIVLVLLLAGCGGETPLTPPVESQQVIQTTESAETPIVKVTSTVPALPIPCTITFDSDRDGNSDIFRMAPDGSEIINLTQDPGYDVEPAWSPDGSQVAFVSNRPQEKQEGGNYILVMNADGSNVRQLTFENDSAQPDWSHDGSLITYSNQGDIYVIKTDGSGQSVNLTQSPAHDIEPTWSPDGSRIAWLSGEGGKLDIFTMNPDGSQVKQLTANGRAHDVIWTIDGEIFSHWDHPDGVCEKCVMNADGSNARDAGGKGELQRFMPFRTVSGDRVECIGIDLIKDNFEIYLVGEVFPDIFLNLTNNPALDRHPDWPANCLKGFESAQPEGKTTGQLGSSEPQEELVLGYAGDESAQWQRRRNFQNACDELGIKCVYGNIANLLEQGVSAVVLNSSPEAIAKETTAVKEALDQGVPVFVLDAETDLVGAYSVMIDPRELLAATLKQLFSKSEGAGDFAYFDFTAAQEDAQILKDILQKEFPKVKVVTTDTSRYNFNENEYIFNDLMNDFPNLKAVWTNEGYTGAVFGIVNHIPSLSVFPMINCEPTKTGFYIWRDRTVEHPGFECVMVGNPPGISYDAAYAAYYLLSGNEFDETVLRGTYGNALLTDFPLIINDNLDQWMKKIQFEADDYVVDLVMSPEEIKDKWFK